MVLVQFRCCGVHGLADWGSDIPISCCSEDPCDVLVHDNWEEVISSWKFLFESLKMIHLSHTNECISILFCLAGLSGEIEGLVFMELYVHWRWCGNNVYLTGTVH